MRQILVIINKTNDVYWIIKLSITLIVVVDLVVSVTIIIGLYN